ncbi:hypothetical protein BCR44DRAFT_90228 [Catenaria anguillulae PL171]|uniref:Ankyrin repeat-containing domain protein n=1 Tax=Catenaria anguillulae PL171 TaxID=765915 RepID=A0A1Y2HEB7_9FUNG|nr:hypothetical protein BCR44DRAFT_90228 [Catenaria anguillulae PL171]
MMAISTTHADNLTVDLVPDLIDPILTLAVRIRHLVSQATPPTTRAPILTPASAPTTDDIRSLLNVLSARTNLLQNTPLAVLLAFPWIDLTLAARLGNLWLCNALWSLKRVRPLQYSTKAALKHASSHGHVHILDWWANGARLPLDVGGGGLESAMTAASRAGHVDVLDWWLAVPDKNVLGSVNVFTHGLPVATENGHGRVLEWWRTSGLPVSVEGWFIRPALLGQVDVFRWWTRFDAKGEMLGREIHLQTIFAAAMYGGHFSIIEHMLTYDLEVDKCHWKDGFGIRMFALLGPQWAYASGNLGLVQRVEAMHKSLKCEDPNQARKTELEGNCSLAVFLASAFGHIHLLDHLIQQRGSRDAVRSAATEAMPRASWLILRRLHSIPAHPRPAYPPDLDLLLPLDAALANGHTNVLDWWRANQLPVAATQPLTCIAASPTAQTQLLKWWTTHCPHQPTISDFSSALHLSSQSGSLTLLKHLRAAYPGFRLTASHTSRAVLAAASHGHLTTLQYWLPLHPVTSPIATLVDTASALGHVHVLEWMREAGRLDEYTHWSDVAVDGASRNGHVHVLDWWRNTSGVDARYSVQAWTHFTTNPDPVGVVGWWLNQASARDGREWELDKFKLKPGAGATDDPWMQFGRRGRLDADQWALDMCRGGLTGVLDMCLRALGQDEDVKVGVHLVKLAVKGGEVAAVEWAVRRVVERFGKDQWEEVLARDAQAFRNGLKRSTELVRDWWEREIRTT